MTVDPSQSQSGCVVRCGGFSSNKSHAPNTKSICKSTIKRKSNRKTIWNKYWFYVKNLIPQKLLIHLKFLQRLRPPNGYHAGKYLHPFILGAPGYFKPKTKWPLIPHRARVGKTRGRPPMVGAGGYLRPPRQRRKRLPRLFARCDFDT